MKKNFSPIFVLLLAATLWAGPAHAKKEFSKSSGGPKSVLGDNTVTLPSGLQYKDVKVGTGAPAQFGNVAWIDYTGWVMPGLQEFDSTKLKGKPFNLVVGGGQICRGLDEGLMNMKVNGKRLLLVPPELGFPKGSVSNLIKPDSTLKYEITLIHIGPKLPKPAAPPATPAKSTEKPN